MNHFAYSDKDIGWQGGWMEASPKPKPKSMNSKIRKRMSISQRMKWCERRGVRFRLNYNFGWQAFYKGRCIQDSGRQMDAITFAEACIDQGLY